MEYHFTKATDVATRIYETGMKQFGEDAEYVLKYLKFLISINDENSAYPICIASSHFRLYFTRCACPVRTRDWHFPARKGSSNMGDLDKL